MNANRPKLDEPMDVLSQIVTAMRLESALYARFEMRPPFAVRFAAGEVRARFGLVTHGTCLLASDRLDHPVTLLEGDCFLLLEAGSFSLCDSTDTPAMACSELMTRHREAGNVIRLGGEEADTTLITGWFRYDDETSRLITRVLPAFLHFRIDAPRSRALQSTLDLLALETEASAPGTDAVIRSLADMLFIHAVRAQIDVSSDWKPGLLAVLGHPRLRYAIEAMHGRIAHPWTIAELAAASGMSRAAFALCFREVAGETPMGYLTELRMRHAAQRLHDRSVSLSEIAKEVGYDGYSAFAKAFRRSRGCTPNDFRNVPDANARVAARPRHS